MYICFYVNVCVYNSFYFAPFHKCLMYTLQIMAIPQAIKCGNATLSSRTNTLINPAMVNSGFCLTRIGVPPPSHVPVLEPFAFLNPNAASAVNTCATFSAPRTSRPNIQFAVPCSPRFSHQTTGELPNPTTLVKLTDYSTANPRRSTRKRRRVVDDPNDELDK